MTPERYIRAGEIFHEALALPPERREAFLAKTCAGDPELLAEVESLLMAHASAGTFVASPHPHVARLMDSSIHGGELDDSSSEDALDDDAPMSDDDEPVRPGQHLGRYEVLGLLGVGGMGTVYRALDPSLGREVAIKAVARTFRGDPTSLKRFEREARILATLSHPNIAAIYGFERLEGTPYLVLERVEGATLADRLARGPMPIESAVAAAEQIVAGLEEAHRKGVIHRDLKPSNVMLAPDGRVKLVDFGLAKATAPQAIDASAGSITSEGTVVGTARYMSPEQVRGDAVDTRTDVWAFGCVLYEMLTGQPVFAGRSVSEVVAAVLRDDPDWRALPTDVPSNVRRLLVRCLRRDARIRLQHIGDARLELLDTDTSSAIASVTGVKRSTGARLLPWLITAASLAALAILAFWRSPSTASTTPPTRLSLDLPARVTLSDEYPPPFALTPAGSTMILEATEGGARRLYVRELADPALRALAGTEDARQAFLSPDGAWVGFFANRKLSKVPIGGGPVLQVAEVGNNSRGGTWAPDGTIVFAAPQTAGLSRVAASGGKPAPLTTLDKQRGETSHRWPEILPGGKWVLFTVGFDEAPYDEARIDAVALDTGERRSILSGAGFARYLANAGTQRGPVPGRLVFVRGGRLHAVGFDPARLLVQGTPEVVLDPVRYDPRNGAGHFAVSESGALLYGPGTPTSSDFLLSWIDRDGVVTRAGDSARPFRDVKASPDGRRIAAVIGTSTESDLWLVDDNGTLSRLSYGLAPHRPIWSARGDTVTVGAEKNGSWRILTVAVDGAGEPSVLFESPNRVYPNTWSADGRYLIFQESVPETGWDLRILEVDATGRPVEAPRPFANTPFHEINAALSRDGRWVAYESNELDGVFQVYVRSFPTGTQKVRVSSGGTRWPAWDSQGTLHYWQTSDETLHAVQTSEKDGQLVFGTPRAVWSGAFASTLLRRIVNPVAGARYDLDQAGTRFLVLERDAAPDGPELSRPVFVLGGLTPAKD